MSLRSFLVVFLSVAACTHAASPSASPPAAPVLPPEAPFADPAPVSSASATPSASVDAPAVRPASAPTSAPAPAFASPPTVAPTYAHEVSFGSMCCGTDRNAHGALERAISPYRSEALGERRGRWGKEGEYDVCFTLAELSPAARARLIREVKTTVGRRLATVRENAPCRSEH